ncbi:MAG: hypothetical protein ABSG04_07705, partial [Verrucomicrobiota bacterium]
MRKILLMAAVLSFVCCIRIVGRLWPHRPMMKTLLQTAAVLSFLFPFVAGVWLIILALTSGNEDMTLAVALGCFLVGNAFFVGGMLFVAAEKCSRN